MMLVLSPRLITVNLNRAKLRHNKEEENVSGREFNLAAVFHISMEFFGFARIQEEGNITKTNKHCRLCRKELYLHCIE